MQDLKRRGLGKRWGGKVAGISKYKGVSSGSTLHKVFLRKLQRKGHSVIYTSHCFQQLAINMKLLFIKSVCFQMRGKMFRDTLRRVTQCELDDLVSRIHLNELGFNITLCKLIHL